MLRIASAVGLGSIGATVSGDADGENATLMQRLAYRRIIDPEIARHRVDLPALASANPVDGPLDLIEQGDHITGIVRIAGWYPGGKDKAGGGFRHEAGFAPKLQGRAGQLLFPLRMGAMVRS